MQSKLPALSQNGAFQGPNYFFIPTNKPTTAENTSTSTFTRKPEAATAVLRAPDDGHCNVEQCLYDKAIHFTIDCCI
jgi:hypothetical protein